MTTQRMIEWLKGNGYWEAFDRNVRLYIERRTKEGNRPKYTNPMNYLLWYERLFPSLRKSIRNAFNWEFTVEGYRYWQECDRKFNNDYE